MEDELEKANMVLTSTFIEFQEEATKATKGNKAAGIRARKFTLALEKQLKNWRKLSLAK